MLTLTACQNAEDLVDSSYKDAPMESSNRHRVTLAKALRTADVILGQISEQPIARIGRTVKSVDVLTNKQTRSTNDVDTAVYLVNYNDGGFAMLGADDRLPSLFAISEEGSLQWSDFEENEGLALYMDYMTHAIAEASKYDTTEEVECVEAYASETEPEYPYLYEKCSPLLGKYVRLWSQQDPYNSYCPYITNAQGKEERSLVGCVMIACGMYLSYYQYPFSIVSDNLGTVTLSWRKMLQDGGNDNLYKLLATLGESNFLKANPKIGSTSASQDSIPKTLKKLNYSLNSEYTRFKQFNQNSVLSLLGITYKYVGSLGYFTPQPGGPVVITGWSDINGNSSNRAGHCWIIDGYVKNKMRVDNGLVGDYETLLHCVWGWSGSCNGYYNWEIQNSFTGNPIIYDDTDLYMDGKGVSYNYYHNLIIFGGAIPNY